MPKSLQLLKEAIPSVVRVALLVDPKMVVDSKAVALETQAGARQLGMQLDVVEMHGPGDFAAAIGRARKGGAQAIFAIALAPTDYARLAALALRDRMPLVGEYPGMAQAGFLMGYGTDLADLCRRAASYIDRILIAHLAKRRKLAQPTTLDERYASGLAADPPGYRYACDNLYTNAPAHELVPHLRELFTAGAKAQSRSRSRAVADTVVQARAR